jgi:hypothetical protein
MRRGLAAMAGVLALGLLAGCAGAPARFATEIQFPNADETARAFLAEVASGADVARDPRAGPQFAAVKTAERLRAVRALIPKALPTRVEAVGWRMTGRSDDGLVAELSYAWSYPHQKLVMRAVLHREHDAERWVVTGVEARRTGAKTHGLASVGDTAAPKT